MKDVMRMYKTVSCLKVSHLHCLKNQEVSEKIGALTKELKLRHKCLDSLQNEIIVQSRPAHE